MGTGGGPCEMRGVRRPPRMHQDLSGADNLTPTRQNAHMPLTVRGRRKLTLTNRAPWLPYKS